MALFPAARPVIAGYPATTQSADLSKEMEGWWDDLQKPEPWNTRSLLEFSDHPTETVAFFKTHLKPLKIEQSKLDKLMHDLASEDEKIWKPAFDTLGYFDPRLDEDVETIFDNASDPVERSRLACILLGADADEWKGWEVNVANSNGQMQLQFRQNNSFSYQEVSNKVSQLGTWNARWQRADRAVVLLQHIGTPEAVDVLKNMAGGQPAAQPTKIAKLALESLEKQPR